MLASLIDRARGTLRDLRDRQVFRAAIVYGTASVGGLGVLDLLRDLIPWLDRMFPALVLAAISSFPIVLIAAWAFELGPGGIRLHRRTGQGRVTFASKVAAGAAVTLVSVVFGWTLLALWSRSEVRAPSTLDQGGLDPARLAVLYFDDHSPGGELTYLANGLTEDLINALVPLDALQVTSRNGVKPFRDSELGTRAIARQLNVGTLVEGSVTGDEDRVRATVQLVDARTDEHLLSEQFEADRGNVLALQDELSAAISRALREYLGVSIRARQERQRTDSPGAREAYQEARMAYEVAGDNMGSADRGEVQATLERADSLLKVAEAEDPDWPDPAVLSGWVALRQSFVASQVAGFVVPEDSTWLLGLARRAVERSDGSAAAFELRGATAFEISQAAGDRTDLWDQASEDLSEAVALAPERALALSYLSTIRRLEGDFRRARFYAERALDADAYHEEAEGITYRLFEVNLELKDWREADRWCAEGRQRFPQVRTFLFCRLFLHALRPEVAEPSSAWAVLDSLRDESSVEDWEFQYRTWAGYQVARVLARNGMADSATAVLDAYRPAEADRPWLAYDEAHVRLALGDEGGALDLLELYLTVAPNRAGYVATDWLFEDLWDHPRFQQITGTR